VSALGNHRGLPLRGNWALLNAIFNTLIQENEGDYLEDTKYFDEI
jgi:hypothetical protein